MTLNKYKEKRNFTSTNEPKGETKLEENELIFVVQKHAATRLHYDFRLEMDGVLKSWAVPKGPSINPEDKRLAVMVEDHPYDYKDFEGNIAKGNYGAGNVIVWDKGTYSAHNVITKEERDINLSKGMLKGHLKFILNGQKLKGLFSLVKLTGKQENAWLLMKHKDEFSNDNDILLENKSVVTNITLEELAKKSGKEEDNSKKPKKGKVIVAEDEVIPDFIEPMLAESIDKSFNKANWLFENKFDGYRTIAVIKANDVNLFSRNRLSFNDKFKVIADDLKNLNHKAVIDGEVVIEDDAGRSDFQLLQNYQKTGIGRLKYYVFDLLNLDGNDTRSLTLLERKELLKMLVKNNNLTNVFYSEHVLEQGKPLFDLAKSNNLEGIMAKQTDSPYRSGKRSSEWLKIKITKQEEAIIAGITEPKGARNYFGAIILSQYKGNNLEYIGNCGTGFDEATLKELYNKFESSFTDTSPFNEKIKLQGKVQWLKPKFVAQIKFSEWTEDRHLRHPVYLGLRVDKEAKDVIVTAKKGSIEEKVSGENDITTITTTTMKGDKGESLLADKDVKNVTSPSKKGYEGDKKSMPEEEAIGPGKEKKTENDFSLTVGKVTLLLTHQNKIYFPQDEISKGDIVDYYNEVAEYMLPYLIDRPQSMNRFPHGINGQSFYQKDVDIEKIPSWLKTAQIFSESNNDTIDYLLCNDKATLLYMANLGCIEVNPWNSTINQIENPDWIVIDLDPEKIDFREVVKTARVVKEVLDELNTECYCKTSGATGLHIYVPLGAQYDYDTVKIFAELIAHKVYQRLPEITSITRSVQKRQNKVYIDFLQNRRGQTLAAPYSVRPKPGATVSTPLEWNEVNEKLSPDQFTIKNTLKRLEQKGDLWKPVLGKGADIQKIIMSISPKE